MALQIAAKGLPQVKTLRGGFDAWVRAGYPVESSPAP